MFFLYNSHRTVRARTEEWNSVTLWDDAIDCFPVSSAVHLLYNSHKRAVHGNRRDDSIDLLVFMSTELLVESEVSSVAQ